MRVGCTDGWVDNGEDCTRTVEVPAEYETRRKRVISEPARVVETVIPAEYKEVERKVLKTAATTREEVIPAEYEVVKVRKIKTPATTREEVIPAKFVEVSKQVVTSEANSSMEEIPAEFASYTKQVVENQAAVEVTEIPAEYETITKKTLVKKGGFTEWREVLCPNEVTSYTIRQVQEALKDRGYQPGPLDNILGAQTKAALTKFQKDNGLPIGNLDLETLRKLGIQF